MNYFANGDHALTCGVIIGALERVQQRIEEDPKRAEEIGMADFKIEVEIDDEGSFTNRIFVERPSGTYIVTIEKEE